MLFLLESFLFQLLQPDLNDHFDLHVSINQVVNIHFLGNFLHDFEVLIELLVDHFNASANVDAFLAFLAILGVVWVSIIFEKRQSAYSFIFSINWRTIGNKFLLYQCLWCQLIKVKWFVQIIDVIETIFFASMVEEIGVIGGQLNHTLLAISQSNRVQIMTLQVLQNTGHKLIPLLNLLFQNMHTF